MTPENLAWDRILAGSDVTFRIVNPHPRLRIQLKAQAVCVGPDGSRQASVGRVVGSYGVLKMPVSVTAPGVYRFEWAVTDSVGRRIANGARELTLQPWMNDRALVGRAVTLLRAAVDSGNAMRPTRGVRAALRREADQIEREATALAAQQNEVPGAEPAFRDGVIARTRDLDTRAERALVLAKIGRVVLAKAPDSRVLAFEDLMWENRNVDRQLPTDIAIPLRIARRCVQGEHEPISVKLLNVTLEAAAIGARIATQPGGPRVRAFEVKPVPTAENTTAWDPIVPLGDEAVTVPALETREIWLDVDLAGVAPGEHRFTVALGGPRPETTVDIALDVLPFEMVGFDSMRLVTWARYEEGNTVQDMLAHGATVFMNGGPGVDLATISASRADVDFTGFDKFIAPLVGHDVFLLLGGLPNMGVPVADPAYVPRYANYIGQVVAHLAARGIDENHVALYPTDEPGGNGWDAVNTYVTFGRQVLKAHPGMRIYVDGGGDLPMFHAMAEVTSIWSPGYYMLPERSPEMNLLRASGKAIWSYDCGYAYARPIGWTTKTINIAGQYRMSAPFAFSFGATGIGYWSYNCGNSMWESGSNEDRLVYTNPNKTQTACRRWEAVREGVEDARILIALRERLSDSSVSADAKAKIRHLLESTLPDFAEQSLEEVRIGAARYVLDETNNDATVDTFRRELLDCVAAVSRVPAATR
jgi:hypothetical protein